MSEKKSAFERKAKLLCNILLVALVSAMMLFFAVAYIVLPEKDISESERRYLADFPDISASSLYDGDFFDLTESYFRDRIAGREFLRSIKASFTVYPLFMLDSNGYYMYDDAIYTVTYMTDEESVRYAAERLSKTFSFFDGSDFFCSVIPDKEHYICRFTDYPCTDTHSVAEIFMNSLGATYIDISVLLDEGDYYCTDLHWKQQSIEDVAALLVSSMGVEHSIRSYQILKIGKFSGVYKGQSAFKCDDDDLLVFSDEVTDSVIVTDMITGEKIPLYDYGAADTYDMYSLFSGGSRALVSIQNPDSTSGKTLYLFRDSFSSSLAPLLAGNFSEIILIDPRYISPDNLGKYIKPREGSVVLYLFSAGVLNDGYSFR